jgi:hypothetical protein
MAQQPKEMRIPIGDSSKRVLFDESSQPVRPSQRQVEHASNGTKDMTPFEWSLRYQEQASRLILLLGKVTGDGVIKSGHVFSYGKVLRVDYEDDTSPNLMMKVETSKGERNIVLSEERLVLASCEPSELGGMLSKSKNFIATLQPFISGQAAFEEYYNNDDDKGLGSQSPLVESSPLKIPKKSRTQKVQNKPKKKQQKEESSSTSDESENNILATEVVTPGGELSSGIIASEQNTIRRQIMKSKLVKKGHIFTLPITIINRPPFDPTTGRRPLEIREPHNLHVQNLKKKMKINPHATVVPFLVMVDPVQCGDVDEFDITNPEKYNYFVIGGSHSAEARRQLIKEHPTTYFFKYAECKIYVGLSVDEAKLLAWDHNNDNDYRQKMSSIERIRFFHYEYVDALRQYGPKLFPGLRRQCLNEVGIVVDDSVKSDGLRKYEPWFQLAFRDGIVWELQDLIFTMWESKEVKGQKVKKGKIDPQVEAKATKNKKLDFTIEEVAEDMKLTPWRSLQGIKDETLLVSVLSRVISKELSLDDMVLELSK